MSRLRTPLVPILALALALAADEGLADPNAPFTEFQRLSPARLDRVQIKLTYIGPTDEPVSSVGFAVRGRRFDVDAFRRFYRYRLGYAGDRIAGVRTFAVSRAELRDVLDRVSLCPGLTSGMVADRALISFSLHSPRRGGRVFEAGVDASQSRCLFRTLRRSLAHNREGLPLVDRIATAAGVDDATADTLGRE